MLQKTYAGFGAHTEFKGVNLVVSVTCLDELESLARFYSDYSGKIRGVSLPLSLLEELDGSFLKKSNINYFQVCFEHDELKPLVLSKTKKYNSFTEILIPDELYSFDLISKLSNVDRVVIVFNESVEELDTISADLVSSKYFPFTKDIPFCHAKIDQCVELFEKSSGNSFEYCDGCVFQSYCSGPKGFIAKPVKDVSKDIIKVLKENEGSINRL